MVNAVSFPPVHLFPNSILSELFSVHCSYSETPNSHSALMLCVKSVNSGVFDGLLQETCICANTNASPCMSVHTVITTLLYLRVKVSLKESDDHSFSSSSCPSLTSVSVHSALTDKLQISTFTLTPLSTPPVFVYS